MKIKQGDIFWAPLREPVASEPGRRRPCVVVQNDLFNVSRLNTVVCCVLTTNVGLGRAPGNVLLSKGEGNIQRTSVVNVSQVVTLNKFELTEKIGTLAKERVDDIVAGLMMLLEPREV